MHFYISFIRQTLFPDLQMKINDNIPILTGIISLLLLSCTPDRSQNEHAGSCQIVNIKNAMSVDKKINLSTIADSIAYVVLEVNDRSIFGKVSAIEVGNKYVLISDRSQEKLLLFNLKGKFLRTIGKRGKGPEEYISLSKISLNEHEESVYIYDGNLNCIFIFSLTGEFLKKINLSFWSYGIKEISNDLIACYIPPAYYNYEKKVTKDFSIQVIDHTGTIKQQLLPHKPFRVANDMPIYPAQFYNYYDTLTFKEVANDTIYRISGDGKNISATYFIETEHADQIDMESMANKKAYLQKIEEQVSVHKVIETKDYLFINLSYHQYAKSVFYNKSDGSNCNVVFNYDIYDVGFHNDIDGGMPFWPKAGTNDGKLINYFYPSAFLKVYENDYYESIKVKNTELKQGFIQMIEEHMPTGNLIIQIITLR